MIKSKQDLKEYLEADRIALGRKTKNPKVNDVIWKYEIYLRKCEYYNNCGFGVIDKLKLIYYKYKKYKLGTLCNYSIPINVCGKGLSIAHVGTIVINSNCSIGKNCRIHVDVNIGSSSYNSKECPIIGDNVYIAPGAKIYGQIKLANNIAIGANSVVNKSFLEENITIAGVPSKKISNKGTRDIILLKQEIRKDN